MQRVQGVFTSTEADLNSHLTGEDRRSLEQFMENAKIRLNNCLKTAFDNPVERFIVEKIYGIQMRLFNDIRTIMVYVKWHGYDSPTENTWEPVTEMENTVALEQFYAENRNVVMDINIGYMSDERFADKLRH